MPLLADAVSKININNSLIINPGRNVLNRYLMRGRQIMLHQDTATPHKYNSNIKFSNMTTEQKRKYLLLKYVRQYT